MVCWKKQNYNAITYMNHSNEMIILYNYMLFSEYIDYEIGNNHLNILNGIMECFKTFNMDTSLVSKGLSMLEELRVLIFDDRGRILSNVFINDINSDVINKMKITTFTIRHNKKDVNYDGSYAKTTKDFLETIINYKKEVSKNIVNKNNEYLIPCGWDGDVIGHAICMHYIKNDQNYILTISNSGDGIEYHSNEDTIIKRMISEEVLINILSFAMGMKCIKISKNVYYKYLKKILSINDNDLIGSTVYVRNQEKKQYGPTCSYYSVMNMLNNLEIINNDNRQNIYKWGYTNYLNYISIQYGNGDITCNEYNNNIYLLNSKYNQNLQYVKCDKTTDNLRIEKYDYDFRDISENDFFKHSPTEMSLVLDQINNYVVTRINKKIDEKFIDVGITIFINNILDKIVHNGDSENINKVINEFLKAFINISVKLRNNANSIAMLNILFIKFVINCTKNDGIFNGLVQIYKNNLTPEKYFSDEDFGDTKYIYCNMGITSNDKCLTHYYNNIIRNNKYSEILEAIYNMPFLAEPSHNNMYIKKSIITEYKKISGLFTKETKIFAYMMMNHVSLSKQMNNNASIIIFNWIESLYANKTCKFSYYDIIKSDVNNTFDNVYNTSSCILLTNITENNYITLMKNTKETDIENIINMSIPNIKPSNYINDEYLYNTYYDEYLIKNFDNGYTHNIRENSVSNYDFDFLKKNIDNVSGEYILYVLLYYIKYCGIKYNTALNNNMIIIGKLFIEKNNNKCKWYPHIYVLVIMLNMYNVNNKYIYNEFIKYCNILININNTISKYILEIVIYEDIIQNRTNYINIMDNIHKKKYREIFVNMLIDYFNYNNIKYEKEDIIKNITIEDSIKNIFSCAYNNKIYMNINTPQLPAAVNKNYIIILEENYFNIIKNTNLQIKYNELQLICTKGQSIIFNNAINILGTNYNITNNVISNGKSLGLVCDKTGMLLCGNGQDVILINYEYDPPILFRISKKDKYRVTEIIIKNTIYNVINESNHIYSRWMKGMDNIFVCNENNNKTKYKLLIFELPLTSYTNTNIKPPYLYSDTIKYNSLNNNIYNIKKNSNIKYYVCNISYNGLYIDATGEALNYYGYMCIRYNNATILNKIINNLVLQNTDDIINYKRSDKYSVIVPFMTNNIFNNLFNIHFSNIFYNLVYDITGFAFRKHMSYVYTTRLEEYSKIPFLSNGMNILKNETLNISDIKLRISEMEHEETYTGFIKEKRKRDVTSDSPSKEKKSKIVCEYKNEIINIIELGKHNINKNINDESIRKYVNDFNNTYYTCNINQNIQLENYIISMKAFITENIEKTLRQINGIVDDYKLDIECIIKNYCLFYNLLQLNITLNVLDNISEIMNRQHNCYELNNAYNLLYHHLNINEKNKYMLLYEIFFGRNIRKEQYDIIENMYHNINTGIYDKNKNATIEHFLMGKGKTSVIIPILAMLLVNKYETSNAYIVVPKHMYVQMINIMGKYSGLFGTGTLYGLTNKSTNFLFSPINYKKIIVIDDISLKFVFLNYLNKLFENTINSTMMIHLNTSFFLFDEFDSIYNPMKNDLNVTRSYKKLCDYIDKNMLHSIIYTYLTNKVDNYEQIYKKCLEYGLGVKYGYSNDEEKFDMVIPYNGPNKPMENSTFSNHIVILFLNIIQYKQKLTEKHIQVILSHICDIYNMFTETRGLLSFTMTNMLKIDDSYINKFLSGDKQIIKALYETYCEQYDKGDISFNYYYFVEILLPKLKITDEYNNISFCDVIYGLYNMIGFSGTVDIMFNYDLINPLRKFNNPLPNSVDMGAIYSAYLGIYQLKEPSCYDWKNIPNILQNYSVFIDSGAYFRSNKSIYEVINILENYINKNISYIIFVNENNELMIKHRNNNPIKIAHSDILSYEHNNIFIFYDYNHCIGYDIPQYYNLNGLVSVDTTSNFTFISQSMFRLRHLNYGQSIDFACNSNINNVNELLNQLLYNSKKDNTDIMEKLKQVNIRYGKKIELSSMTIKYTSDNILCFDQSYQTEIKTDMIIDKITIDERNFKKYISESQKFYNNYLINCFCMYNTKNCYNFLVDHNIYISKYFNYYEHFDINNTISDNSLQLLNKSNRYYILMDSLLIVICSLELILFYNSIINIKNVIILDKFLNVIYNIYKIPIPDNLHYKISIMNVYFGDATIKNYIHVNTIGNHIFTNIKISNISHKPLKNNHNIINEIVDRNINPVYAAMADRTIVITNATYQPYNIIIDKIRIGYCVHYENICSHDINIAIEDKLITTIELGSLSNISNKNINIKLITNTNQINPQTEYEDIKILIIKDNNYNILNANITYNNYNNTYIGQFIFSNINYQILATPDQSFKISGCVYYIVNTNLDKPKTVQWMGNTIVYCDNTYLYYTIKNANDTFLNITYRVNLLDKHICIGATMNNIKKKNEWYVSLYCANGNKVKLIKFVWENKKLTSIDYIYVINIDPQKTPLECIINIGNRKIEMTISYMSMGSSMLDKYIKYKNKYIILKNSMINSIY